MLKNSASGLKGRPKTLGGGGKGGYWGKEAWNCARKERRPGDQEPLLQEKVR